MKNLRTIQAESMAAALAEVKRELGDEAVILHTRTFTRHGLLGVGARRMVEITASARICDLPRPAPAGKLRARRGMDAAPLSEPVESPRTAVPMVALPAENPPILRPSLRPDRSGTLPSDRDACRMELPLTQLDDLSPADPGSNLPDSLRQTYLRLLENEVAEDLAAVLVERIRCALSPADLQDAAKVRACLAASVASLMPAGDGVTLPADGGQAVIALVGPTGVGKTTTIAKLAADFAMRQGKRVGLITIDTFRIAAIDQLRTYADILDVPLVVASSPEELAEAVERLADREVVLIDTAGRSPHDAGQLAVLERHLTGLPGCEVHLVLSAATGRRAAEAALVGFGAIGVDRLIFTKLDEAVGCGVMLGCLHKAQAALSYVTTGQNVPADIDVGTPMRLAEAIAGEALGHG